MDIRPCFRAALAAALAIAPGPGAALAQTTLRVSIATDGVSADAPSATPAVSADGRYVAFVSVASNLTPGDTNGKPDVFLRDTISGLTSRVSVSSGGSQANSYSSYPSISGNGRHVVFYSDASNLVPNDTNGFDDVFSRDTATGVTTRVSVATDGAQGNQDSYDAATSADGRYVAFQSIASNLVPGDANNVADIFLRDTVAGTTRGVSTGVGGTAANGFSIMPSVSADGRYVAFTSEADNLVKGDTNGHPDIFVRDMQTDSTVRVSIATGGAQANSFSSFPSISANGRFVAFVSDADNLTPGDTNGKPDIFVRDMVSGATVRISLASDGGEANDDSSLPSISGDGRYVAFRSAADNLVPADTNGSLDIFVRDTVSGVTRRQSVATDGTEALLSSYAPRISADGRYVVFDSEAANLASGDSNAATDIFVRGPLASIQPSVMSPTNTPVRSSPTAVGGIVYFGDDEGRLHAVSAVDGSPVSGFPVPVSAHVGVPVRIRSRPAVYSTNFGTFIYVTTTRGDVCRVAMEGSSVLCFSDTLGSGNVSTPAVTTDGAIYVGLSTSQSSSVVQLDADTSLRVMGVPLAGADSTISSVAVANNKVYVGLTGGAGGDIVVLNAADLTPLSSGVATGEGVSAPPYVVGEDMYVGTLAGNFYKLNSANNNVDISFGDGGKVAVGEPLPTSAFFSGSAIFAGSSMGKVWRVGLDGAVSKAYDTWNPSALVGGVVVERVARTLAFGTSAGGFYKVPLTGAPSEIFGPSAGFSTAPTYDAATGRYFVGSDAGAVVGF